MLDAEHSWEETLHLLTLDVPRERILALPGSIANERHKWTCRGQSAKTLSDKPDPFEEVGVQPGDSPSMQ